MKKLMFSVLAVLLLTGTVYAAGIPSSADPKNAPEIWTMEVYNNSGSALTSGTVVVWDMGSDTTDANFAYRTMWVTTSSTTGDCRVAGVTVDPSIAAGSEGTICVYGPVFARTADASDPVAANTAVAQADAVTGQCGDADSGANGVLGWSIYAAPVALAYGGDGNTTFDGKDGIMTPIFVNVSNAD